MSRLCKLIEERINGTESFPDRVISRLLFQGQNIAYVPDDRAVRDALMFGFVRVQNSNVQIANRIFEMRLYNKFLLDYKEQNSDIYTEGSKQKNQLTETAKEWIWL